MLLPDDSFLLLSIINMKLRDKYSSLDGLCEEEGLDKEEISARLAELGYSYTPEYNAFKPV